MQNKFEKKLPLAIAITKVQQGYTLRDAAEYAKRKTGIEVPISTIKHNHSKLPQCFWETNKKFEKYIFKIQVISSAYYTLDINFGETSIESYFRLMGKDPDAFSIGITLGKIQRPFDYDTFYGSIDEAKNYVLYTLKVNHFVQSISLDLPNILAGRGEETREQTFQFIRACLLEDPSSDISYALKCTRDIDLPLDLLDVKKTLTN